MAASNPPRVMILADGSRPEMRAAVDRLRPTIERHLPVVGVSLDFSRASTPTTPTWRSSSAATARSSAPPTRWAIDQRPVLGVNLGRLGFLAALQPEQLDQALPEIAAGRHQVVEHLMFECTATRGGKPLYQSLGLNEASVLAGPPFTMVDVAALR